MIVPPLLGVICLSAGLLAAPVVAAETMNAVQIDRFGAHDVLVHQSLPRPVPAAGDMLVRVHAAGINPVDAHVRGGHARGFIDVELPHVPGYDLSGVVVEVGADVVGFARGDEVYAMLDLTRGGSYAEYAIVKPAEAAPKPERLTHLEAASLPLVSLTAWQALFDTAKLSAGQTVLIHGGSGGVGSVAIQLAKARGARVITTASAHNHDFVRSLGTDIAVDHRNERFEDVASDVDVVLDVIGGQTQERSLQVLREGGVLVSLVGLGEAADKAPRGIKAVGILVRPDAGQLREIAALVDAGKLRPQVSQTLPLAEAIDAHKQIETGHTRGKVVLEVLR